MKLLLSAEHSTDVAIKIGSPFPGSRTVSLLGGGEGELTKHLVSKKKIGSTFQGGTNDLFPEPNSFYAELETLE